MTDTSPLANYIVNRWMFDNELHQHHSERHPSPSCVVCAVMYKRPPEVPVEELQLRQTGALR